MNDLLDLASIQAGTLNLNYQSIQVDVLLKSLIVLVQNRANDRGIELIIDNHMPGQIMHLDSKRIRHALFNLLSNAIKFTPSGGRIYVRAIPSPMDKYIDLCIEDTGVGIKEQLCERIETFFKQGLHHEKNPDFVNVSKKKKKTKAKKLMQSNAQGDDEKNPGSIHVDLLEDDEIFVENDAIDNTIGLGLTLVHRLIELHGGHMHVESEVNKGTLMCCSLPLEKIEGVLIDGE
jgi:signal transduction histidine kinase